MWYYLAFNNEKIMLDIFTNLFGQRKGLKTFMVGGCVRDRVMKRESNDIDFVVVGTTPEEMTERGFELVGQSFPVFLGSDGNEYALARTERKTGKGYHGFKADFNPDVTLEDDLLRRDLTINAMAQRNSLSKIIDPYGGKSDIENKILRHVSSAFAEDPVRVLRIARFNAQFGPEWEVHLETKKLIAQMIGDGMLNELTTERVWKETEKALKSDHPMTFFDTLYELGALYVIFPEMQTASLENLQMSLDDMNQLNPKVCFGRLINRLKLTGSDVDEFMERLRVPNDYVRAVTTVRRLDDLYFSFRDPLPLVMELCKFNPPDLAEISESLVGLNDLHKTIMACKEAYDSIGFDDIDEEDQKWLKGQQIGSEINRIRAERLTDILY